MLRISRSLLIVSSAVFFAACSSGSSGNNGQPVTDNDTGVDTAPAQCTAGSACTSADGSTTALCQADGSCSCTDGTDDDACNTAYTDGTKTYSCQGGQCKLAYPAGPYGLRPGNVFPNVQFMGYKNGDNSDPANWVPMSMLDYFDPEGDLGVTGIYLVIAAQWCGPCNIEAGHLPKWWTTDYSTRGAKFVTIVYQNAHETCTPYPSCAQATQQTADQWIATHKINFDIGIDPANKEIPTGSFGLPHNYIIDPRTMKVYKTVDGIDPAVTTGCTTSATCCDPAVSPTTCSEKYECAVNINTCLAPGSTGPLVPLEYVMKNNGATAFDLGLAP